MVVITLAKKTMGYGSWEQLLTSDAIDTTITNRVSPWVTRLPDSADLGFRKGLGTVNSGKCQPLH